MIRLVDGTCWMCEARCDGRWCTPDCRDAWEMEIKWITRAAELAIMGRVEIKKLEVTQ